MKRLLSLLLLLALLLSAFGCGRTEKDPVETADPAETRDPSYDPAAVIGVRSEHYSFNNSMMSYLFNYNYTYFLSSYYSYLSMFGLDPQKSLKEQIEDPTTGTTWYDYFMGSALDSAKYILALCEASEAYGVTLDENDTAYLLGIADEIRGYASSDGVTADEYIRATFGEDASFDAALEVNRLSRLANKTSDALFASLEASDEEIEAAFEQHKSEFLTVPYYSYTFSKKQDAEADTAQKEEAEKVAAASHDGDSFYEAIRPYFEAQGETYSLSYFYNEMGYGGTSEAGKWLWDESRTVGDATVIESDVSFTVFLLAGEPKRDDTPTASVRHILIESSDDAAKAKAEEILAEYLTDPTEEHFASLAGKYTEDPGSKSNGGLYESFQPGEMVAEFNDWSFDPARKPGDTEIVQTSFGFHIMYFVDAGDPLWKVNLRELVLNEKANEIMDPYFSAIEKDDAVLDMIIPCFPM